MDGWRCSKTLKIICDPLFADIQAALKPVYLTVRLTSEREVHRDGAEGFVIYGMDSFGNRNEVLCHQVDEILSCCCLSSECQHALFLVKETDRKRQTESSRVKIFTR